MPECAIDARLKPRSTWRPRPRSNASAQGDLGGDEADVKEGPHHSRSPVTSATATTLAANGSGNGVGYKYAHDDPRGYVEQDYLGVDKTYYEPTGRGYEKVVAERLAELKGEATGATAPAAPPADGDG